MLAISERERVLSNPQWLLTSFDPQDRSLHFVETTRAVLTASAFVDGRTPLSPSGRRARIALRDAIDWLERDLDLPRVGRFIAHVGFCGSTLLARTLDASGAYLTYKEPQIFTDVSALKTRRHACARDPDDWRRLIAVIAAQFRKRFGMEAAAVKLSNWPVNLLDDLTPAAASVRVVFLTSTQRDYLVAVLRGGAERVRFVLQFARKLRNDNDDVHAALSAVEATRGLTYWQRVLRCVLIVLASQEREFAAALRRLGPDRSALLDGRAWIASPEHSLMRISSVLAAPVAPEVARVAVRKAFARAAKTPNDAFKPADEAARNAKIAAMFGCEMEESLRWAGEREIASALAVDRVCA